MIRFKIIYMLFAMHSTTIWTDGSCLHNPGPGGWAFIIEYQDFEYEVSCCSDGTTTNNEMELTAIIKALEFLYNDHHDIPIDKITKITVMSDSNYAVRGINEWIDRWISSESKSKQRPNWILWKKLYSLKNTIVKKANLSFKWVKAHSTNEMNNRVDQLARQRAEENN
jgi:ribonuclease HI